MRVIKNGLEETEITCPECASILAYTQEDVCYGNTEEIMGIYAIESNIKCPVCHNEIVLHRTYHSF